MAANSSLMNTADAIEPLSFASNDSDSGYDEKSLSTASIASSIYDYEQENGRTYHAYNAGKYALPNDEGEQERMDRMPSRVSLLYLTDASALTSMLSQPPTNSQQQALLGPYRTANINPRRRHRHRYLGHGRC
jgi:hypothetical protein